MLTLESDFKPDRDQPALRPLQAPQQATAAPAMPPGIPPGSIDLTAPMSDEQLLHLGERMLQDQSLARSIGQEYPSVYKRVRSTCSH